MIAALKTRTKLRFAVFSIVFGTTVGALGLEAYLLWQLRQATWRTAQDNAQSVLGTLGDNIERNISLIDQSLAGIQTSFAEFDIANMNPDLRSALLFDTVRGVDYLGAVVVLSPTGHVLYSSREQAEQGAYLGDREYFTTHLGSANETYVSGMIISRLRPGDPTLVVSRRLSGPDGSFLGVVAGVQRLQYFNNLFNRISLGPNGAIALVRSDGRMIWRTPASDGQGNAGMDMSQTETFQRTARGPIAYFSARSNIDGIERFYVYERLGTFPLILVVAFSIEDVLSHWVHQASLLAGIGLLISGVVVSLVLALDGALVRREKVEAELAQLASTDPLTKLANRRVFEATFQKEWRSAARSGDQVAILMLDLDHFKRVNDTYGHRIGDHLLAAVAEAIRASLTRPRDLAGRYGGEEFAVLLPETDLGGASVIAERIREAVERVQVPDGAGAWVGSTVSVGVAAMASDRESDLEKLLQIADRNLYTAKQAGRNRVVCSSAKPFPDVYRSPLSD